MALPPERITIKRRRDDEPVETLYIEQKRQRSHYLWCRITDNENLDKPATSPPPLPQPSVEGNNSRRESVIPRVPSLRITQPGEDAKNTPTPISSQLHSRHKSCDSEANEFFSKPLVPTSNTKKLPNPLKFVPRHRTFHLSKGPTPQNTVAINGVRKPKKRRQDLACFIETGNKYTTLKGSQDLPIEAVIVPCKTDGDLQLLKINSESSPRKRPLIGDVEKKWRNENWIKPLSIAKATPNLPQLTRNKSPTGQWDCQSVALAETLHQIALQEIVPTFEAGVGYPNQRLPKIKPKPSKARSQDSQSTVNGYKRDEVVDRTQICENEDDFVYDTFIRTFDQSSIVHNGLNIVDSHKIGILIISEQDQSEWEKFGGDEESDKDWNSEEEDENAEDYYGNDYPEDEVESGDEYGRGAYNFRKYASDDEEYDEETTTWSDEDYEGRYP